MRCIDMTGLLAGCVLLALSGAATAAGKSALEAQAEAKVSQAEAKADQAEAKSERARAQLRQKLEAAQKRLDAAAREVADLSVSLSEDAMRDVPFVFSAPQRAVLGLNIGSARGATRDDGVEVVSVSPGGAAAEAGLRAGDVLTEVNGKSLKRDGDESPRSKLLAAMREVEPDTKVPVKYLRDGKSAGVSVTARSGMKLARHLDIQPFKGVFEGGGALPTFAFARAQGVFGAAELVPLNPKLGQYFGTDKGLLVVRAPSDARLKLEDGDVILDIDGRVPSSPAHALRILGSYQAGEQLKLNVLRLKKRLSFDIQIPEGGHWERTGFMPGEPRLMIETLPAPPGVPTPPLPTDVIGGPAKPDIIYFQHPPRASLEQPI